MIERQREITWSTNESKRKRGNEFGFYTTAMLYSERWEGGGGNINCPSGTKYKKKKETETKDGSIESIIPFAKSIHRKSLIT